MTPIVLKGSKDVDNQLMISGFLKLNDTIADYIIKQATENLENIARWRAEDWAKYQSESQEKVDKINNRWYRKLFKMKPLTPDEVIWNYSFERYCITQVRFSSRESAASILLKAAKDFKEIQTDVYVPLSLYNSLES